MVVQTATPTADTIAQEEISTMAETRDRLIEFLKILGFVLLGFAGGFLAKPFIDGFMDGFNDAVEERSGKQPAPGEVAGGAGR
ncbi:MAG: hypothetical protein GVY32_01265 [Gammaproteobacteria bacterium]|jgi:hypothetical protein|nr:hypothetical protein [Gammaproteobacteria bacterium]